LVSRLPPAIAAAAAAAAAADESDDLLVAAAGRPIVLVPEAAGAGSSGGSKAQQQQQQTQDRAGADAGLSGASRNQVLHAQQAGLVVLSQRWLADSVSSMQLLPLQGYKFSC
jgi:hypothetical protein